MGIIIIKLNEKVLEYVYESSLQDKQTGELLPHDDLVDLKKAGISSFIDDGSLIIVKREEQRVISDEEIKQFDEATLRYLLSINIIRPTVVDKEIGIFFYNEAEMFSLNENSAYRKHCLEIVTRFDKSTTFTVLFENSSAPPSVETVKELLRLGLEISPIIQTDDFWERAGGIRVPITEQLNSHTYGVKERYTLPSPGKNPYLDAVAVPGNFNLTLKGAKTNRAIIALCAVKGYETEWAQIQKENFNVANQKVRWVVRITHFHPEKRSRR